MSFKNKEVLKGLDLMVKKGSITALLGPNGAGKTTTVKILSTLLAPGSGEVFVNGHDVVHEGHAVRSSIGLTGQYAAIDEILSGYDNLVMMGRLYHLSSADAKRRAHELLEQFDLVEATHRAAKTYSGGMKRRLDLAASLIATPPVLFLDEPTTGLDPRSRVAMWEIINKLVDAGVTILLTTQYLEEADKLADQIAVLNDGKIIAQGTADELKQMVGKDRLELEVKDEFEKAVKLLAKEDLIKDKEAGLVSVAVNEGTNDILRILKTLEDAGIHVASFTQRKPTLDDVFLQLTGHATTETKSTT